ncbi:hypothetical protein QUB36_29680 [Microcoleus sp. AT8-B1]|uniref:hypothetical protein n=1 Tax=unclassified Microcoleus TaxID=2642155 RepID=UPI002FD61EE4
MLSFTWENISQLPQLPLKYKNFLPEEAGLYFVTMNDGTEPRIIYIGRATDLNVRWQRHHRQLEMDFLASMGYLINIRWLALTTTPEMFAQAERSAIRTLKPVLNDRKALTKVISQLEAISSDSHPSPQVHFTYPEAHYAPKPILNAQPSQNDKTERVLELKAKGWGKAKIILEIWGVSKGGSQKYKDAEAEYKRLIGEAEEK